MSDVRIVIELLGTPKVSLNGKPIVIKRKGVRALLYYLAMQNDVVSRNRLINVFWPEREVAVAQRSLSSSLYELKNALPGGIITEHGGIRICGEAHVDTVEFERCMKSNPLPVELALKALKLYRGTFMDGFFLANTSEFQTWQAEMEVYYLQMAVDASIFVAEKFVSAGNFGQAQNIIDRALKIDPLREDLYRIGMNLRNLCGDRPGASRIYQHLVRMFDEELGITPTRETSLCYQKIIQGESDIIISTANHIELPEKKTNHNSFGEGIQPLIRELLGVMESLSSEYAKNGQVQDAANTRIKAIDIAEQNEQKALAEYFKGSSLLTCSPDFMELAWGILPAFSGTVDDSIIRSYETAIEFAQESPLEPMFEINLYIGCAIYWELKRKFSKARAYYEHVLNTLKLTQLHRSLTLHYQFATLHMLNCSLYLADGKAEQYLLAGENLESEHSTVEFAPAFLAMRGVLSYQNRRYEETCSFFKQGITQAEQLNNRYLTSQIKIFQADSMAENKKRGDFIGLLQEVKNDAREIGARNIWVKATQRLAVYTAGSVKHNYLDELKCFLELTGNHEQFLWIDLIKKEKRNSFTARSLLAM